jgi:hypothetical protein
MLAAPVSMTRDHGGRRLGIERRRFSYVMHIPERRSSLKRRSGFDQRNEIGSQVEKERRAAFT